MSPSTRDDDCKVTVAPRMSTGDRATHDHALGGDRARHLALLTDDDFGAADITLDLAIDLQGALADDLSDLGR